MSKISYTENFNLTQYSEVDEPVFLNDITRDNALIDSALQNGKETAENAVSIANTAKDTADYAKSVADGVASDLQVTNQNVADLDARVTQNEADIALLQPAKITALENKIDSNTGLINALSNELDSVEAEVEAHGNRLDSLESATGQLRTDVDTLRGEFDTCCDEVQTHLSALDTEQGVQNERLGSLETRMDSAETRLDNLETEDETITGQVTVLTDRVNQLLSDLDPTNIQSALALTQQVIQNKNDIATLVGEVTALGVQAGNETLITTAQTLSGAINELAGASVSIDTALDATSEHAVQNKAITVAVNALQSALSDLQTALNTVDTREAGHYTNLSNGVSGLDSRVGALESAVGDSNTGLVKDVADLQSSVSTAQTDISALEVTVGDASAGLVKDVADNAGAIAGLETTVGNSSAGLVKDVADNADDISALQSTVGDSSNGLVKDVDDLTVDVNALESAVGDSNSGLTKRVGDVETAVGALEDDAEYEKWTSLAELDQSDYSTYGDLANAFYPILTSGITDWTEYEFRIVVRKVNSLSQIYTYDNCNMNSGFLNFKLIFDAGNNGMLMYVLSVMSSSSYWHSFEARGANGSVTWSYSDLVNSTPGDSAKWYLQRRKLRH